MKFSAIIKKGAGRGRDLGFPTANFEVDPSLEDGIYVGQVNSLPALIFIGANVTFDETVRHGEAYLLDYSEDLYGQEVSVETLQKIRENKKFDSQPELVEQMTEDERLARDFFKTYNKGN